MREVSFKTNLNGTATTLLLVFACFTLVSSGYLAWLYHLMTLAAPESVDALTMGVGYACQGIGIAIAALVARTRSDFMNRITLVALVAFHFACAAPAALSDTLAGTLAFGYAMNLLCGLISMFYLLGLASFVGERRRGIVFGCGYACSIAASWVVSLVAGPVGSIPAELVACAVFSLIAVGVAMGAPFPAGTSAAAKPRAQKPAGADDGADAGATARMGRGTIALACIMVLLMSMVKNMGFNFPTADIGSAINLEMSRLFYAVGLVIAGIVIDRNRKFGAILCMAALVMPFALMALGREPVSSAVLWAIDYFFYGFFSVFRIVLFADLAVRENKPYLAGFGLMIGRFGDALGLAVSLSLGSSAIALVAVAAVLFATTVFVFYQLFAQLYQPEPAREKSEREIFDEFAVRYELSPREREVVRLALGDQTNAEIAAALYVSESTVKFHMRNALKKTGCKNRMDLLAKYSAEA